MSPLPAKPRRAMGARILLAVAIAVPLGLIAGCGGEIGDDGAAGTIRGGSNTLGRSEVKVVRDAQQGVRSDCRARVSALGGGKPTSAEDFERVTSALQELGELAQAKPEAETADGVSARLALEDIAEDLEGTNYDERLVELIDAQLAALPEG